jgi:GWxTD domain-containing protein
MKAAAAVWLLAALAAAPAAAGARAAADLINFTISPEHGTWLIGPYGRLATDDEVRAFMALVDDAQVPDFIERFWARRDPDPARPGNPVREAAEQRAAEADRRFTEAAVAGRRTDRGAVFVLYGEPEEIEFQPSEIYGEPPIEFWRYDQDAPAGLDGRSPQRAYRFIKRDDLTVHYVPGRPGRFTQTPLGPRKGSRGRR